MSSKQYSQIGRPRTYTELLDPRDPLVAEAPTAPASTPEGVRERELERGIQPEVDTEIIREPGSLQPPTLIQRKNQANMSDDERSLFRSAMDALIDRGIYGQHVFHHTQMMHRMHGGMAGFIGYERFLSWHRVYLAKLEEFLRIVDDRVFIPYWDWTIDRDIPGWLADFMPQGLQVQNQNTINVTRNPGVPSTLPTVQRVNGLFDIGDWQTFVRSLENGPHNRVHSWVWGEGGTMNDIEISPADPLFWFHHANVDRIWHQWQIGHPGLGTGITGTDAILDPWAETISDVVNIEDVHYRYI